MKKRICRKCRFFYKNGLEARANLGSNNSFILSIDTCLHKKNISYTYSWFNRIINYKQSPAVLNKDNNCKWYRYRLGVLGVLYFIFILKKRLN